MSEEVLGVGDYMWMDITIVNEIASNSGLSQVRVEVVEIRLEPDGAKTLYMKVAPKTVEDVR